MDVTAGGDFLGPCDQKRSYKHVSVFGLLRFSGHFLIPLHAILWTASYGTSWRVIYWTWWLVVCVASIILATWLPALGDGQSIFRILTHGMYLRIAGKVGWVGICLAGIYCMTQLLLHVQNPLSLNYSDCAGSWRSEQYCDIFVKAWALEATV